MQGHLQTWYLVVLRVAVRRTLCIVQCCTASHAAESRDLRRDQAITKVIGSSTEDAVDRC